MVIAKTLPSHNLNASVAVKPFDPLLLELQLLESQLVKGGCLTASSEPRKIRCAD
jgi:hypothetical protein